MRVLLASFGSRGDLQPMVALALGLRAAGHAPTLCGPPNFAAWAGSHGIPFQSAGADMEVLLNEVGTSISKAVRSFRGQVALQFSGLREVAQDADVIVGASLCVATESLGTSLGKPACYLAFTPAAIPSRANPAWLFDRPSFPELLHLPSWWVYRKLANRLYLDAINHERAGLGLSPIRDVVDGLICPRLLIASDPALSTPPPDCPPGVEQTGTLFYDDPLPLSADIEAFLEAGPPPVYVGFGSMVDANPTKTTRLVLAAAADAGVRLVVSAGWAKLGEGGEAADALFIGPTAHGKLFPRLAGVVHHGGAGTTAAASRAGVPQLIVPHLFDQFSWARAIHALGVSPPSLPRARLTRKALADRLQSFTGDATMKAKARALSGRMIVDGVDRAVRAIVSLGKSA